jgi:hypothetical protein
MPSSEVKTSTRKLGLSGDNGGNNCDLKKIGVTIEAFF